MVAVIQMKYMCGSVKEISRDLNKSKLGTLCKNVKLENMSSTTRWENNSAVKEEFNGDGNLNKLPKY